MKKIYFFILSFLFSFSFLYAGEKYSFRVQRVIDGDTIELETGEHVRYIGIDTPETRQRKGDQWIYKPQPFAREAKILNEKLVKHQQVQLEFDVQPKDRYGRLLAYVYVGDRFVNLELIQSGLARLLTIPPNVKYAHQFRDAYRKAKEKKQGMWE